MTTLGGWSNGRQLASEFKILVISLLVSVLVGVACVWGGFLCVCFVCVLCLVVDFLLCVVLV